ncbi:MAG: hypothetical protein ABI685_03410 [Ferruginibacter sp.]
MPLQNLLQKSKLSSVLFIVLLFLLVCIWQSCKKTDSLVNSTSESVKETPENFFKLPANASPVLQRIAQELEKQNKTKEFITAFIAKEGFPVWDKSRLERHKKSNTASLDGGGPEDTTVYIPLVVSADHYVTGFLKATVSDAVDIKIYRQNDYINFPFQTLTSSTSITTAENFAIRMMSMDKDVFGSTEFKIADKRMFNNSPDYSDTANIQRFVKLTNGIGVGGNGFADGTTISNYQYEVCWTANTYRLCGSGFTGSGSNNTLPGTCLELSGTLTYCTLYETDGSSGGGGTGGGGSGGGGTWPFPPTGGSSGGALCQEFGKPITNSFVSIECNPSGGNPWPPENSQSWLDEIWLTYNVKDSTVDPCITKALDTLKSIHQKLPTLIRNFFGSRPNFEMVFKKYVNSNWSQPGNAPAPTPPEGAITTQNLTTNIFNIAINRYYSDCTDLGLAVTIIHEAMHCYLMNCYRLAYFSPDSTAIRISLATQYGYLFPPLPINPSFDSVLSDIINGQDPLQHQDMITRYQNEIATALSQFAVSKGISIDSSYCRDLSWTGCFDSKAFKNGILTETDKTRIKNRCFAEKDPYANLTFTDANNNTFTVNANNYPKKGHPCH